MKGPPSPRVFIGFRFGAIERDVAGPGVCEASAPSHARLRAGSCEKLAQAAELPHGLLLLKAHALLFPLTMLFPSAFANEDLVCFFLKNNLGKRHAPSGKHTCRQVAPPRGCACSAAEGFERP